MTTRRETAPGWIPGTATTETLPLRHSYHTTYVEMRKGGRRGL